MWCSAFSLAAISRKSLFSVWARGAAVRDGTQGAESAFGAREQMLNRLFGRQAMGLPERAICEQGMQLVTGFCVLSGVFRGLSGFGRGLWQAQIVVFKPQKIKSGAVPISPAHGAACYRNRSEKRGSIGRNPFE